MFPCRLKPRKWMIWTRSYASVTYSSLSCKQESLQHNPISKAKISILLSSSLMDRVMKVCKITSTFHKPLVGAFILYMVMCLPNEKSGGFRRKLTMHNQITDTVFMTDSNSSILEFNPRTTAKQILGNPRSLQNPLVSSLHPEGVYVWQTACTPLPSAGLSLLLVHLYLFLLLRTFRCTTPLLSGGSVCWQMHCNGHFFWVDNSSVRPKIHLYL